MKRGYPVELVDIEGAIDMHCHPYPDALVPRVADDIDIAVAARDAGVRAIMLKAHHESTVSRAYLVDQIVPGIRVYGGVVLNSYVGYINPAAVEVALTTGGKEVWMPTVDAGYHGEVHGVTGAYGKDDDDDAGPVGGVWVLDDQGNLKPEVLEVLKLIAEHDAILGTCHLSPTEIVALVKKAREMGVEKIVVTHPFYRVPDLDLPTLKEIVRMGAMPEFGYCTVSAAWQVSSTEKVAAAINEVGASRCIIVSDTGQRHNPMPSEALRIFAQTLFEKGVAFDDIPTLISTNPANLLDLESDNRTKYAEERIRSLSIKSDPTVARSQS